MTSIWVARLSISTRTSAKINGLHHISDDEARGSLVCRVGLLGRWDEHPDNGWRVLVDTTIRGRPATVVIYPRNDPMGDAWNLGSAYFID